MEFVLLLIFAIVVGAVLIAIFIAKGREAEREAAKQNYLRSLSELKAAPTDADLKQRTLALGRDYSNLTRNQQGQTLFDEVALMNDINAACAAATVQWPQREHAIVAPMKETVEARLATLNDLKEKGLIQTHEYERHRAEILASI